MKRKINNPFIPEPTTNNRMYIGIDNGVSGTLGWSGQTQQGFVFGQIKMPVFSQLKYTKAKSNITRVDYNKLYWQLEEIMGLSLSLLAVIERPMINPGRFNASLSAIRALECTQIALENLSIPHRFVDSKEWQKHMLPSGLKGADNLKKASLDIGKRYFPSIKCSPDADGLLMAEWARRTQL